MSTLTTNKKKLDAWVNPGIFLGFKPKTKWYIVYNLHTLDISTSHNVIFYENLFPKTHMSDDDNIIHLHFLWVCDEHNFTHT